MSNSFFTNYLSLMSTSIYKTLAKINKSILPSYSKKGLDLAQAKKWQLAIIGYRAWVTKKALG
ncbi:hypothetical protein OD90_0635 [Dokdonia sp. Hel_I_53]|nr:hypothetical protein OD90_0635 [Dokdonia sp. Hel_I_53]